MLLLLKMALLFWLRSIELLLLLIYIYCSTVSKSRELCSGVLWKPPQANKTMVGHVIGANKTVRDQDACEIACYLDMKCMSINYDPKSCECQLCSANSATTVWDLVDMPGRIYREIEVCGDHTVISVNECETAASSTVNPVPTTNNIPPTNAPTGLSIPFEIAEFPRLLHPHYIQLNGHISSMSAFTVSLWMKSARYAPASKAQSLISIATIRDPNALTILARTSRINFKVGKDVRNVEETLILDEQWHHICATWANTAGNWAFYIDGALKSQLDTSGFSVGYTYTDAKVLLGQDIDNYKDLSQLETEQSFLGSMAGVAIWNLFAHHTNASSIYLECKTAGNVFSWSEVASKASVSSNATIQNINGSPCGGKK